MALLKLSGLIDGLSGKLNGSVLGSSASGNYLKSNSFSQQPGSIEQLKIRYKIGLIPQMWRKLTSTQQIAWKNAVIDYPYVNRVGVISYYTGYQLFNFINFSRSTAQIPLATTPPVYSVPSTGTYRVDGNDGVELRLIYTGLKVDDTIVFYASKPLNGSVAYKNSLMREIEVFRNNAVGGSRNFITPYLNIFPAFVFPQNVWIQVKIINRTTGISSGLLEPFLMQYVL